MPPTMEPIPMAVDALYGSIRNPYTPLWDLVGPKVSHGVPHIVPVEAKEGHRGRYSDILAHMWPKRSHMGTQRVPTGSIGDIWGSNGCLVGGILYF